MTQLPDIFANSSLLPLPEPVTLSTLPALLAGLSGSVLVVVPKLNSAGMLPPGARGLFRPVT
jgi:hypothetical protein